MEFRPITWETEKTLFIAAWEQAFARRYEAPLYDWMFNGRNRIYGIFHEGQVVAGYCLLPYQVVFDRQPVAGALGNNVFVVPQYQKANLFVKLCHYVREQAAEAGLEVLIALPNRNSLFGHQSAGWSYISKLQFLERTGPAATGSRTDPHLKPFDSANRQAVLAEIADLSREVARGRSFSVIKDQAFFQWRYLDRPSNNYQIYLYEQNRRVLGYIVYKYYEPWRRVHILDVEAENSEVFGKLIEHSPDFGAEVALTNVWGSSIYRPNLLAAGFKVSAESHNYLVAIRPGGTEKVSFGPDLNLVLGDNEVF